jgi:hypothetical protein
MAVFGNPEVLRLHLVWDSDNGKPNSMNSDAVFSFALK